MQVYLNGKILPKEKALISPDDRGFLFSDGVYEVILAVNGRLYRKEDHFRRLARSLSELKLNTPDMDALGRIPQQLIEINGLTGGQATVYIQITRGSAERMHSFPPQDTPATVYAAAKAFDPPVDKWETGVHAILVPDQRWLRCDIKSIALLPNVLAYQQAKEKGAFEAILVRDGAVTECTHSSFAAVFNGKLITYPESHYILPGITRKAVLALCRHMGIPAEEYPILVSGLNKADECMVLGTTTEVMPLVQVDGRKIGNGKPGPVTRKLQQALRKEILGG